MKKLLALFLALIMALSLVACGDKAPADDGAANDNINYAEADVYELAATLEEPITLTFWSTRDAEDSLGARWKACFEEYCASFPNDMVKADFVYIPNASYAEIAEKIPVAAAAGELPDLMVTEDANVLQYQDILCNLNDYVSADTLNNISAGLMQSCTNLEGEKYGVPIGRSAVCLYVNNDILTQYGIDYTTLTTWDAFYDAANKIYTESNGETYGWALNLDWDCWYWESAIYSAGGQFLSDDGSYSTFGKAGDYVGAKWLQMIQDSFNSGCVLNLYDTQDPDLEMELAFFEGKAAMLFQTTSAVGDYEEASDFDLKCVLQPTEEGCEPSIVSGGACTVLVDSTEDEVIRKIGAGFIEWMMKDEWVVDFAMTRSYFVSTYSALEDPQIKAKTDANENWASAYAMADYVHKRAASNCWSEIVDYLNDQCRVWVAGGAQGDINAMLDGWSAEVDKIIADNA